MFKTKELKAIEPKSFQNCLSLKTIKLPTCTCLPNTTFEEDIISNIYIDKKTQKSNPGFVYAYKDQIVVYDSLDALIKQNKSLSEINKTMSTIKEEIDKL